MKKLGDISFSQTKEKCVKDSEESSSVGLNVKVEVNSDDPLAPSTSTTHLDHKCFICYKLFAEKNPPDLKLKLYTFFR